VRRDARPLAPEPPPVAGGGRARFGRIQPMRAHEYVAEQLRRHIGLGLVAPGEPFPPERELARMFGVGRATIQQALGLLEGERLIVSRRGRNGGTFLVGARHDEQRLARLLADLRRDRDQVEDALVYRRVVEEATAALAAQVASEDEIEALVAANRDMRAADSDATAHRYDTEFHLRIASASHSALLYRGVEQARLLLNSAILAQPESESWHDYIETEHDDLIEAIRGHDARRARRAMAMHLGHAEKGIRALLAALR
jgi:GntR family transcriptional regulator, transcriptional repressor for pyruvate dehydrogenase complex